MNYKELKRQLQNKTAQSRANKELYIHYRELSDAAVGELRFKNMKVEYLLGVLDEIESFTNEILVKSVIKNAKERNNLDTLIHAKLLFYK